MKKKLVLCVVSALITLFVQLVCFSGCGNNAYSESTNKESETSKNTENSSPDTEEVICKVLFDSDGGTQIAEVRVSKGEKVSQPQTPYKQKTEGGYSWVYEFLGWYDGETKWNFDAAVEEDLTLKAKWGAGVKFATAEKIYPD